MIQTPDADYTILELVTSKRLGFVIHQFDFYCIVSGDLHGQGV